MQASPMSDDLSALAWVYEEVRKSLESAQRSLSRCLKEAVATGFSDVDAIDPAVLRSARQHIHQGVGALELAGLPAGALLLRASENLVQRYVARPQSIQEEGVKAIEAASFALLDLIRRRLAGKPVSSLALFPQYEAVMALAGGELPRPSDLWIQEWPAVSLDTPVMPPAHAQARAVDVAAVNAFEAGLLKLLRGGQAADAQPLVALFGDLSADASERQAHRESATWVLACGFLQGVAQGRLPLTVHVKRVLSAMLSQLRAMARKQGLPSDRLAHELLFFCAQAGRGDTAETDVADAQAEPQDSMLDRLRQAFGLSAFEPVDLAQPSLGRFDPAWVAQAAKRVVAAKDGWSAVASGEVLRLGGLNEQFSLVADSLRRLYPDGDRLANILSDTVAGTVQGAKAPSAALAMEVATCLLYLEASLDEGEFEHPQERERIARLAQRIDAVAHGLEPEPLEGWMEALYRRVSDRQTIGSVVQELRSTLGECEKHIDQFFRDHERASPLVDVPSHLQSMKGVLAVLGLNAAAQAVTRMRSDVESLLSDETDLMVAAQAGVHDRLATNLGALGFLVDMLAVQPALAKSLFVFNEEAGVLAPIMGRTSGGLADADPIEMIARPAEQVERVRTQEVAETLVESVTRDEVPLSALSEELQYLADTPLVQEQPELAAKVADAQAAVDRASDPTDAAAQNLARDEVVAALNEFVKSVSGPQHADQSAHEVSDAAQALTLHEPLQPTPTVMPESTGLEDHDEMRDVFIEEAREVVLDAQGALADLQSQAGDVGLLTTLRRAFHTLKGSSRMVGLKDFGEAAWACEQLFNAWLASQLPASDDLQKFTAEALAHLGAWVEDIAAKSDAARSPDALIAAADALRLDGRRLSLAPQPQAELLDTLEHLTLDLSEETSQDTSSEKDGETQSIAVPQEGFLDSQLPDLSDFTDTHPSGFLDSRPPDFTDTHPSDHGELDSMALGAHAAERMSVDLPLPQDDELTSDELAASVRDSAAPAEPSASLPMTLIEPVEMSAHTTAATDELEPAMVAEPEAAEEAEGPEVTESTTPESSLDKPQDSDEPQDHDEQIKVIGPLRISIPLFNIYLNEADEQSRRLSMALSEWSMEWHRPVGDEPVALAHSLAGNSGTVGYTDLSRLARALEHALMKSNSLGQGDQSAAALFTEAAEEIRRLLHQFAAGFLKAPPQELLVRLENFEPVATPPKVEPEAGARGHLRLVRPDEPDEPKAEPELDLDKEDIKEDSLQDDDAQEVSAESEATSTPEPEPEPEPELSAVQADVADAVTPETLDAPQPLGLGLPEMRPFESLLDLSQLTDTAQVVDQIDLGEDADIEAVDAIDADLFPIFEEEAQELLPQLAADVHQWIETPAQRELAAACMRTLHTFKGGARLAGAMRLGELAHRMESAVERLSTQEAIAPDEIEHLEVRADLLREVFEALLKRDLSAPVAPVPAVPAKPGQPETVVSEVLLAEALPDASELASDLADDGVDDADDADDGGVNAPSMDGAVPIALTEIAAAAEIAATPAAVSLPIDWTAVRTEFRPSPFAGLADAGAGSGIAAVRVRPRLLDRLVNHAGEVSITRTRLASQMQLMRGSVGDLTDNLDRLRQQLRDIELQAETQLSTRMEAARAAQQEFDPLEFDRYTRFQELTRMMAESVNDVATVQRGLIRNLESAEDQLAAQSRLTRDLQDDLLRTRMVEFDGLSDRLYRVVRLAAKETGKQVRLDIAGGQTEVDRGVLDRMTGAFEHLLRNCVTHGIELPEARQKADKDPMGAIIVAVRQDGNEVSIEFRDDGAGLNLKRIRSKAQEMGLLDAAAQPTDEELSQLIFTPGFSTADKVTELAGRGIGMDVVRADVNAMGGRIETATAAGQGTSFKLILPLTTAVTKVVMVRCGDLLASIPTNLVELVRRAPSQEVEQAYASSTMPFADLTLPFFWFGSLLQHSPRGSTEGRTLPVVIVRSAQQRVALHVDEVLGNQDVVVKNLGAQLSRVPGLAGMTLLASGAISLIYNPVALATVYGAEAQARARLAPSLSAAAMQVQAVADSKPLAPLMLVVDDSLTVRRVTQRLLTREGYRVTLAKDGIDALEKMAEEIPVVVLSDIEMPRMNGFDLVRNLRSTDRWKDIPIVMITSRIAQKHRDYAMELGVNHYLGKPYSEEELLSLVNRYASVHSSTQAEPGKQPVDG